MVPQWRFKGGALPIGALSASALTVLFERFSCAVCLTSKYRRWLQKLVPAHHAEARRWIFLGFLQLSVPKNRNRRKIAAFSNRKVLNRRFCRRNRRKIARKSQKNRRKIASDFLGRGIEIAAFPRFQIAAFSGRLAFCRQWRVGQFSGMLGSAKKGPQASGNFGASFVRNTMRAGIN